MMSHRIQFFFLLSLLFALPLSAQKDGLSKKRLQEKMRHVQLDEPIKTSDFFAKNYQKMGLSNPNSMRFQKSIEGRNGFVHHKYQQYYNSFPVFGSAYILHEKNGAIQRASGYYLPLIEPLQDISISKENAINLAIDEMNAEVYAWEAASMQNFPSRNKPPNAKLVIIDKAYPQASNYYALAYQIDIYSAEPLDKKRFFVDANTGNVLLDLPLMMHHAVPGKGVCKYYGEQDITIDSIAADTFLLRDLSRNGNATYDGNRNVFRNNSAYWDLTNEDQDEVAIDAHYCTEKYHDFLLNTFGWNGLGNQGESMDIVVHAGSFVNAFWDGDFASFGDGDCNNGPLTTLEVVAHEFTHGLTDYTSDLIYSSESGAINESMSDVFGKALEYYEDPDNFKWQIGHSFLTSPYDEPFRSMEDPHVYNDPKMYKGMFWTDGGGVHTNSSIGNHWFYLLVEGGTDINEAEYEYNVEGIGMDKAIQIVFLTQTTALTPNSTYSFYSEMSIAAAEEIFGANAPEVASVREAWKAVGLPFDNSELLNTVDLALSFPDDNVSVCLADEYYPMEVILTNISGKDFNPDSLEAILTINELDFEMLLEDPILAGESKTYSLDSLYFLQDDDDEFIYFRVEIEDYNLTNNYDFIYINNAYYPENDLALRTTFLSNYSCLNDDYLINFRVINESCMTLPQGTAYTLYMEDIENNFSWSKSFTTPRDLLQERSFSFQETVEIPVDGFQNPVNIRSRLEYENEVFLENNIDSLDFPSLYTVQSEYLQTFDFLDEEELWFDGFINYEIKEYNGESYFAASHFSESGIGNLCADPNDIIDGSNYVAYIELCADLQDFIQPSLSFDMIQFRTDENIDFPELYDYSSMARVTWDDGNEEYSELIYNQTEGDLYQYDYDLPVGFSGKIRFEFFNYAGDVDEEDYLDYDVILFDNLQIIDASTATKELDSHQNFDIYPNPSSGIFNLSYEGQPDYLTIQNINGQEVLNLKPAPNRQELNLNHLPDGYYLLSLLYPNGLVESEKLVKISD